MTVPMLAATGPSPLWYLTRGTGLVALILLSASVVLGVVNISRWGPPRWPRFATAGLHRNVSLLVVAVLAIHIVTAEADTFAPVGWLSVVVPFASPYRPVWLGLGTLAFDLILALVVTSVLRGRLGYRAWRVVHWAAYLSWPVAVLHGLGTGTDTRLGWVLLITVVCVAAVLGAIGWRLVHGWPSHARARLAGGATAMVAIVAVGAWTATGPMRPGWAKKAGTPATLLATRSASATGSASPTVPTAAPGPVGSTAPASGARGGVPAPPFSAALMGTLHQAGPGPSGDVTIDISARVSGAMAGALDVALGGQGADGGVSLRSSTVTFGATGAPSQYRGTVVALDGTQMVASVSAEGSAPLTLGIDLRIDPASDTVSGTLQAQAATVKPNGGSGNGDGSR